MRSEGDKQAMPLHQLLVLPGDGIGPDVTAQALRTLDWLNAHMDLSISYDIADLGGAALDAHGVPVTEDTMDRAGRAHAILVGAVGGPAYDEVPFDLRPEQGLLRLRAEFDLYANVRPAICFDALVDQSSLKPEIVRGLDIVIVRELTSGLYFGEPRGIFESETGRKVGLNTQRYTSEEIERVARFAFELARHRRGKVCSMEKANVMEAGALWRAEVEALHRKEFADIELTHMYADNGAMQLVRDPKQFDVIVTDNMFGDILSDEAAMLTGSLGMLPSASIGKRDANGKWFGLFEPVHGSAPDIAGQGMANPIACILSLAMALRYAFREDRAAETVERAVQTALARGHRTRDLMRDGTARAATTIEITDAILRALEEEFQAA